MENISPGVLNKALDIIEILLQSQSEIGISELARLSGLEISTVHRIVTILCKRRYLKQNGKRGKYSLGLKILEFERYLRRTLKIRDVALPFLEKLRTITGEATNLAVLESNFAVYIEHIECYQPLRTFTEVGNRVPLHCTGIGKILLAYSNEEDIPFLVGESLTRCTENTITDLNELKKEFEVIRREGVAVDNGENDIGIRCIAAPVRDMAGNVIAAISVSGPYTRLNTSRMEELKTVIKSYGLEISKSIGYIGGN